MDRKSGEGISSVIRTKLSSKGLSVHALEKKAGLKHSAVQNILYGKSKKPSIHIIQAIAHALDCTVSELLEETDHAIELRQDTQTTQLESNIPWESDLYLEVLILVNSLAKRKYFKLSKNQMLSYADEIYAYTLKSKQNRPDKNFADWLIEKRIKM